MEILLIASLLYAALKKGVLDGSTSAKATWTKRRPDRAKKRAARRKRWERSGLLGWSMVQLERLVIGSARLGWDVGAATISGVRTGVPAARSEWRTTWQRNHPEPGSDHESEEGGPEPGPGPVQTTPSDHPDAQTAEPGPWPNTPPIKEASASPVERFRLDVYLRGAAQPSSSGAWATRRSAAEAVEAARQWARDSIMSQLTTADRGVLYRTTEGAGRQVGTFTGHRHPSGLPPEDRCEWKDDGPQEAARGKLKVCLPCAALIDAQTANARIDHQRAPGLLYPDDLASQEPPVDGNGEPWGEPIPLGSSSPCGHEGCTGTLRPIAGQTHFDADGTAMVGTRCDRPGCGVESSFAWTWDAPDEDDEEPEDDEPLNPGPRSADGSTDGVPAPDGTTPSTEGTRMGLQEIINRNSGGGKTRASVADPMDGRRGGVAAKVRPAGGEAEVDDLATLKRIAAQVVQQHEDSEFMKIIRMCQTLPEGTDFGDRVGKVLAEFAQACVALGKVGDEVAEMAPSVSAIAEHVRGED